MQRHVILDVETTGLSPENGDRVIEVGAVAVQAGIALIEFHSLVFIRRPIPKTAQRIHGITNEMLVGQPEPEKIFPRLREFIGKSILVAHNAQFDIRFLRHELARLGLGLNNRYLCTLELSRKSYPQLPNHKLETVYRHLFGKTTAETQAHRALADARMAAKIWIELMKK